MTITLDYNNDKLIIEDGREKHQYNVKQIQQMRTILEEIFNRIDTHDVILEKVDEDYRTIIGEW